MAFAYSNSLAATVNGDIVTALNGGSMEILDGSSVVLAQMALSNPCGTVSNKVLTFSTISDDTSINATGTAATAQLKTSGGTTVITGLTVGTSGTNIIVNTVSFVSGKNCSVSSLTFTQP